MKGNVLTNRHGYQISADGIVIPKQCRPATLGEAKAIINATFDKNKWTLRDRDKYMEIHGVTPKGVHALSLEEARTILDAMAKSRMVLFRN